MFSKDFYIPVDGDKVFRSPKYGQRELRAIKGVKRIWVDDRANAITKNGIKMVKVTLSCFTEQAANECMAKGNKMIMDIIKPADTQSTNSAPHTGVYCVPMDADKVFRSPKYGQAELKKNHKILRIKVDDRENAKKNAAGIDLVRVWITAPSKEIADACYEDGRKMVIALMEKAKKEATTPKLSDDDIFFQATIGIKEIIRMREERGAYDHMDDANIKWYINWREDRGITNHAELGMRNYEDPRPTIEFDYPLDDWGEYQEKFDIFKHNNPEYKVIG